MILIFLMALHLNVASSFRGPHHPRSSISHHHYAPQGQVKLTQDDELLHDTMHLKEDLGPMAEQMDISSMSEQELEFHYFKLHDTDNNTKLDGLEILHAIQHTMHDHDDEISEREQAVSTDNEIEKNDISWIVEIIDKVLEEDDLDNDGYLGYVEFVHGRQRGQREQLKNIW